MVIYIAIVVHVCYLTILYIYAAIGNETDFVSTMEVFTFFPSPSARQTLVVNIGITDDLLVEETETLDGVLFLTTNDSAISLAPGETSISIIDDDCMCSFMIILASKNLYLPLF